MCCIILNSFLSLEYLEQQMLNFHEHEGRMISYKVFVCDSKTRSEKLALSLLYFLEPFACFHVLHEGRKMHPFCFHFEDVIETRVLDHQLVYLQLSKFCC